MAGELDCLLWCPDVQVSRARHKQSHHLGVLYVGAYARSQGFSVHMVLHGHEAPRVAEDVRQHKPRVVGVSVSSGFWRSNLRMAVDFCSSVKRIDGSIRTVLGGIIPSMFPEDILGKFGDVDLIVCGEGEHAFAEILRGQPPNQILGLAYRDAGGNVRLMPRRPKLEDLDCLPHALAVETQATATTELGGLLGSIRYELPERSATLLTARGCDGACTFCLNPWYYAPVRHRGVQDVVAEVEALADRGVKFLRICDANFATDSARVVQLCDGIERFRMRWSCWQRADMTDPLAYRAMARAGCCVTTFGIESFNEDVRNGIYGKRVPQERIHEAVRRASEAGLDVSAEIILGWPDEDEGRIVEGLAQAAGILKHVDYVNVSFLRIVPNTVLWQRLTRGLPPPVCRRLRLRSMFESVPVWRFCGGPSDAQLMQWLRTYQCHTTRRPGYIIRQIGRTLGHRKRLVWLNRGGILRKAAARATRLLPGGRRLKSTKSPSTES